MKPSMPGLLYTTTLSLSVDPFPFATAPSLFGGDGVVAEINATTSFD